MDDREIVKLFWARSPQAVDALDEAYGPDLRRLAQRLLDDRQDAEECVNDTYLSLWQGIPPGEAGPPAALRPAGHPKFVPEAQTVEHRGEALLPLRRGL